MGKTVGIFGLGLIGSALAERLISGGHAVIGFDPDEARGKALSKIGGQTGSPLDVWQCDLVLSAVFDTEQLAAIIADAPKDAGKVLVSMSTCDPDEIATLAGQARDSGITLVESPISGTSKQVREGTALLLLAGVAEGLEIFEQVADAISTKRERVGDIGAGNKTKLAINCILGLNRAALAEGLVFAEALGLDPGVFLETAMKSAAVSGVMAAKGPMMVARDFTPLGRIVQSEKDFLLIREMGKRSGHGGLPLVGTYLGLMANAVEAGEGDLDNSAVFRAIERVSRS